MFSCPYPFDKFDQVFCPDYEMGAMENVGCVTYRDEYVPRDEVYTRCKWENICNTILHEISHMWFGNLVTMLWWDDLWLNESFANLISFMCMEEAQGLEDIELPWSIFVDEQFWGLRTDQADTTHPIAASCASTADAEDIFDGISYGKGACWLRQMIYFAGIDVFRLGLKNYFAKYSFKNTTLQQFVAEMTAANHELHPDQAPDAIAAWSTQWLNTAGCCEVALQIDHPASAQVVCRQQPYTLKNTPDRTSRWPCSMRSSTSPRPSWPS